jgi:hypothetical protein
MQPESDLNKYMTIFISCYRFKRQTVTLFYHIVHFCTQVRRDHKFDASIHIAVWKNFTGP